LERPPLSSPDPIRIARGLAEALVAGPWRLDDLVERGGRALGRRGRWLRPLARRLLASFAAGPRPPAVRVVAFLLGDDGFRRACGRDALALSWGPGPAPTMDPAPGAPASWPVPAITTPAALADLLGLGPAGLDWFADRQGRGRRAPDGALRHYRYHWRAKPSGPPRLIEAPKPRLKAIQRRLLDEVLAPIPPHEAAHGFRPGRAARSYAAPHVGRRLVLKLDLRDFFASIAAARVAALFRTAGYPEPVARLLAGLCTNAVPADAWRGVGGVEGVRLRTLYERPHLPQGAPTSPALANLCAYRLDCRLTALAASAGACYTRYADDLAFSGGRDFERAARRFHVHACAVALDEGFLIHPRKTRLMRRGARQRVAGIVVNERTNVPRDEYDALKATLHNCARHGPRGQDRSGHADFRAHLLGRIAHVAQLNPARGERLRALFERIAW
jgi:RNA-directed DNA polymerase